MLPCGVVTRSDDCGCDRTTILRSRRQLTVPDLVTTLQGNATHGSSQWIQGLRYLFKHQLVFDPTIGRLFVTIFSPNNCQIISYDKDIVAATAQWACFELIEQEHVH